MLQFTENVTTLEPLTPKVSKARNTAHGDWRQPPEEDEALKWMEWMEDKRRCQFIGLSCGEEYELELDNSGRPTERLNLRERLPFFVTPVLSHLAVLSHPQQS